MAPEEQGTEEVRRATDACLRLLAVRARSRHELAQALARKGFEPSVRQAALERLEGWGYLNDERFARERASELLRRGRLGPRAVLQRLAAHGVDQERARAALAEASNSVEFNAEAAARQVLEKRQLLGRPLTPKERARAGRLLLGRGFSEDVIQRLLGSATLEPEESGE
jgi:regulatory protein